MKFSSHESIKSHNSYKEVEYYSNLTMSNFMWESEKIVLKKYLKKNDVILDLGCGAGRSTFYLYSEGYKNITGIDIASNMINEAKKNQKLLNSSIDFFVGDATKLNLKKKFDAVIFTFNGLTMIPDKKKRLEALKQIANVLKKDKYFIFTTLDREKCDDKYKLFWQEEKIRWDKHIQNEKLIDYGDVIFKNADGIDQFIHVPTEKEVRDMLNISNFKVVSSLMRSEIIVESEEVLKVSDECRFWITQKI